MAEKPTNFYPTLVIKNNTKPNRWLAIPFIGLFIRIILLIPVFIVNLFYAIWFFVLWLVVPFIILFTGEYPDAIYNYFLGFIRFYTKFALYLFGLTDVYPGFGLDDKGIFELHFEKPKKPSRLLAFPILGIAIRCILLIPYFIYEYVLQYGSQWSVLFSWFAVLFTGKYPESLYEFNRDFFRVSTAETLYTSYLTDTYPSYSISMNHKKVKILLIVLGALSFLNSTVSRTETLTAPHKNYNNNHLQDFENSQDMPHDNSGS
jgi:hypothetical protein